uniref:Uncharacterized protein n=1 Tax=Aegilops tauschii subsp. strangulata TaxID=200361 RepID=A0A453CLG1_AEGTS
MHLKMLGGIAEISDRGAVLGSNLREVICGVAVHTTVLYNVVSASIGCTAASPWFR